MNSDLANISAEILNLLHKRTGAEHICDIREAIYLCHSSKEVGECVNAVDPTYTKNALFYPEHLTEDKPTKIQPFEGKRCLCYRSDCEECVPRGNDKLNVHFLMKNGINIEQKNYKRYTPLANAVSQANLPLIKVLVEYGADIDVIKDSAYDEAKRTGVDMNVLIDLLEGKPAIIHRDVPAMNGNPAVTATAVVAQPIPRLVAIRHSFLPRWAIQRLYFVDRFKPNRMVLGDEGKLTLGQLPLEMWRMILDFSRNLLYCEETNSFDLYLRKLRERANKMNKPESR